MRAGFAPSILGKRANFIYIFTYGRDEKSKDWNFPNCFTVTDYQIRMRSGKEGRRSTRAIFL